MEFIAIFLALTVVVVLGFYVVGWFLMLASILIAVLWAAIAGIVSAFYRKGRSWFGTISG